MKKIILLIILVGNLAFAQKHGNKNLITRTFPLENIEKIKINFYAKITIDQSATTFSFVGRKSTISIMYSFFKFIDKIYFINEL